MNPIHFSRVSPHPPLRSGVRALWSSAVWAVFPLTGMGYIGVVAGMHRLYPDAIPGYLLRGGLYILGGWAVLAALLAMIWGLIRAARWWGLAVFICLLSALLLTDLWCGGMPVAAFLISLSVFFPCMCSHHYGDYLAFAPGFAPTAILFVILVTKNRALSNPPRTHD